jgi:hypothetical protein
LDLEAVTFPYDSLNAASETIEAEQTKAVPEHLKNKHFLVNPKS